MPRVSLHAQDPAFKNGGRWIIKLDKLKAGEANSIVEAIRRVVAVISTLPASLSASLSHSLSPTGQVSSYCAGSAHVVFQLVRSVVSGRRDNINDALIQNLLPLFICIYIYLGPRPV